MENLPADLVLPAATRLFDDECKRLAHEVRMRIVLGAATVPEERRKRKRVKGPIAQWTGWFQGATQRWPLQLGWDEDPLGWDEDSDEGMEHGPHMPVGC